MFDDQRRIGLLGNGGQARELRGFLGPGAFLFRAVHRQYLEAGADDLIDIETDDPSFLDKPVLAAVGGPGLRRRLVQTWGGERFAQLILSSLVSTSPENIGEGVLVAPGAVVTSDARLGKHVHVNVNATIGHDCAIGAFSTVCPGANFGGHTAIGAGCFVGIGAVLREEISVCDGAFIGAGAVVINDITHPGTYVGNPARRISEREGWTAFS
jgi:sugar O-acyltransferase (sialic acid O-acetyltransferase NeuD family)